MDARDSTNSSTTIYDDEVFKMACDQFSVIADYLNIVESDREWATYPKGGVAIDPTKLSRNELEAVSRRYMQEMIPFVGPHTDIMGPDMGTNEQIMAWFMDTYSVYMGYAVNEIVTGKPVAIGGTEGRREATGRGVVYLIERAMNILKMNPEKCTAIVQGIGNVC